MKQVPHSLSYHETSLTKVGVRPMHAPASKIDERESEMKSFDTTWSSVYPMIPLYSGDSAFALISALISSIVAPFSSLHVRSTTETSGVGTRNAMPVSLPLRSGITLPTAFAAPVDEGMMFWPAPRPPRQSLPDGPSTVFCVAFASSYSTEPLYWPWVESYLKRYAAYLTSQNGSLTALTQAPSFWHAARHTRRPMRPKPEIPRLADIFESLVVTACLPS